MSLKQSFGRVSGYGGLHLGFRAFCGPMTFNSDVVFQTLILIFGFGFWSWTVFIKIKPLAALVK